MRKIIVGDRILGGIPSEPTPKTPEPQHTRPDDLEWQRFGQHGYRCPDCTFASFSAVELGQHRFDEHDFHVQGSSGFPAPHQWSVTEPIQITAICPICSTGFPTTRDLTEHLHRFHGQSTMFTAPPTSAPMFTPWLCEHANESPVVCPCDDDCSCRIDTDGPCRTAQTNPPCTAQVETPAGRIQCRRFANHDGNHRGEHPLGSPCYWTDSVNAPEQYSQAREAFWQRARRLFPW